MVFYYVWIIPLSLVIVPATFIITYLIAVSNGHVASLFPYISDTGTLPPESCIFAQLLNLGALFGFITVYLRHRQLCEVKTAYLNGSDYDWVIKVSNVLLWIGFMSCFGISLVANFQEKSLATVHFAGAMMAFCFGLLYGFGQTVLSYVVDRFITNVSVAHLRLSLVVVSTISFGLMFTHAMFRDNNRPPEYNRGIPFINHASNLTDQAYTWYLVSAFSEWTFTFTSILFFTTFAFEFRKIVLHSPQILLNKTICGAIFNNKTIATPDENTTFTNLEKYPRNIRLPRVSFRNDVRKSFSDNENCNNRRYYRSFDDSGVYSGMEPTSSSQNCKLGSKTWNVAFLRRLENSSTTGDPYNYLSE